MKLRFQASKCDNVNVMEDFVTWLTEELNTRGWSNSELARRAEVTHTAISMIISGHNNPGPELCRGIARALKIPQESVFRKAGLLTELPGDMNEEQLARFYDYYKRLSHQAKEDVVQYVVFKYQQEKTE